MLTFLKLTPEEAPQCTPHGTVVSRASEAHAPCSRWLVLTPSPPRRKAGIKSRFIEAIAADDEEQCVLSQYNPRRKDVTEPAKIETRKGIKYVLRFGRLRRVLALRKV
jgi:hypothetical protein